MLKIVLLLGDKESEKEKPDEFDIEKYNSIINYSLQGSECFINNDVIVPKINFNEQYNCYTQEIIIGEHNDHDAIIYVKSYDIE